MNKQDIEKLMSIEPQVAFQKYGPEPSLKAVLINYYTVLRVPLKDAERLANEYIDKLVEAMQ